ncbi:PREDICTED: trichohyalin-like [Priapulus caudatus]|uniref:Trichohyalin-like n=1 Tax=Priapulus caudatus TaxID=37621 RepID=A0ABM1E4W2_PRICU|nr:PREDICTED: trichohyalin-like [Priapulus caudatus]
MPESSITEAPPTPPLPPPPPAMGEQAAWFDTDDSLPSPLPATEAPPLPMSAPPPLLSSPLSPTSKMAFYDRSSSNPVKRSPSLTSDPEKIERQKTLDESLRQRRERQRQSMFNWQSQPEDTQSPDENGSEKERMIIANLEQEERRKPQPKVASTSFEEEPAQRRVVKPVVTFPRMKSLFDLEQEKLRKRERERGERENKEIQALQAEYKTKQATLREEERKKREQEQKQLEMKQKEDPIQRQVMCEVQRYKEELLKPDNEEEERHIEELIRRREEEAERERERYREAWAQKSEQNRRALQEERGIADNLRRAEEERKRAEEKARRLQEERRRLEAVEADADARHYTQLSQEVG